MRRRRRTDDRWPCRRPGSPPPEDEPGLQLFGCLVGVLIDIVVFRWYLCR